MGLQLMSLLVPCVIFFLADFSILYIQSFVYTVYDEFTGQRQGPAPGPSWKRAACSHSRFTATETDAGEQLQPHEYWYNIFFIIGAVLI